MEKLLVCSCVCDDALAPISKYLLENKCSEVVESVKDYANKQGAEILFLLPEGMKVEGLDCNVAYSVTSPTLSNAYAVSQVLSGNLPRPMIQDDFVATYEGKEVLVVTPEAAIGIKNNFSTKFVAVNNGDNTEIVELPVGARLSEKVDFANAKAILVGGLKGKFVTPSQAAEMAVESSFLFDSVTVYDQNTCIVATCSKLMNEAYVSSCGKCVLCRESTSQFKQIVAEMTTGKAKPTDVDMIKEISQLVSIGSYCPFGQNMTNPLTSAMELFAGEFDEHIKKKSCKCGVCYKAEAVHIIDPDLCTGCGDCIDECPEEAIDGKDGYIHMIDQDLCEQCGKCVASCDEDAIIAVTGKLPKLPRKMTKVGRW